MPLLVFLVILLHVQNISCKNGLKRVEDILEFVNPVDTEVSITAERTGDGGKKVGFTMKKGPFKTTRSVEVIRII